MKTVLTLILAGAALAGATAAAARDGCGPGGHRGPSGHCQPNGYHTGPGVIVAPRLVIGGFYPNRGYWDGHRYRERRERWHGGWRYR
ncbi:MAG: hypothetical protein H7243_04840 [Sphingomonadaceae bacterium]|nr:hypothetical protein [Sphingomonadaceae bacterium]